MAWAKFDDQVTFHKKVVAAGNSAVGVWFRMTCYSSAQLSDGFVSSSVAKLIGSQKDIDALRAAGLIHDTTGGYLVHDYHHYNPSADEVRLQRDQVSEARRLAGQKGGVKSGKTRAQKGSISNEANEAKNEAFASIETKQNEATTKPFAEAKRSPVPSRPVPSEDPPFSPPEKRKDADPDIGWFSALWRKRSGVLLPDAPGIVVVLNLVRSYAEETHSKNLQETAGLLLDAYAEMISEWDNPSWTPGLFQRHWDVVQQRVEVKRESAAARIAKAAMARTGDE